MAGAGRPAERILPIPLKRTLLLPTSFRKVRVKFMNKCAMGWFYPPFEKGGKGDLKRVGGKDYHDKIPLNPPFLKGETAMLRNRL